MDQHLLGSLDPKRVKRVVYTSGACYYGDLGTEPCDETAEPRTRGLGRLAADGVERVDRYLKKGLPIVTAFPGGVYGPGSWFEELIFAPLVRGKRLFRVGDYIVSQIHVEDCVRAIAHLLEHGVAGQRYFLADDKPMRWSALQMLAARELAVAPRFLSLPTWLVALLMGRLMAESLTINIVISNAKLKALGFTLDYPTIDTGVPAVVAMLRQQTRE